MGTADKKGPPNQHRTVRTKRLKRGRTLFYGMSSGATLNFPVMPVEFETLTRM